MCKGKNCKCNSSNKSVEGVFSYLDCSTAHVLPSDMSLLENPDVIAYPNEYGAWVYVPITEDTPDWIKEFQEKGFSPNFIEVVKMAQAHGCYWVKFDSDGVIHDNLEDCSAFWEKNLFKASPYEKHDIGKAETTLSDRLSRAQVLEGRACQLSDIATWLYYEGYETEAKKCFDISSLLRDNASHLRKTYAR